MNNVLIDSIKPKNSQRNISGYGNSVAIEIWYELYFQDLCTYSLKYVTIKEIAEEVVSEVFFKIWKNRKTITFNYSVRSYLYAAVRNQCVDYLRKNKNLKSFSNQISLDIVSSHVTPEEEYAYYELIKKINIAVESLPPRCKNVFRLSRDKGLKYKEIARMQNISIKTVEVQMGKALKYLRSQLIHGYTNQ